MQEVFAPFAPLRGRFAAGVAARVEGLRVQMSEAGRQAPW